MALTTGTGTAGANTINDSFTFQDSGGGSHTCTIALTRTYPLGGDNQVGQGGTQVTGDSACQLGIAYISATYNDPDGEAATTTENSDGASTFRHPAPIGSAFTPLPQVDFSGSDCVSADCEFNSVRTK
ncbi:hypothetical protein BH18ACT1_BH18ACT1_08950 [soil metagenome]